MGILEEMLRATALFLGKKQTYQKIFKFLPSLKIEYPKYYSYQGRKISKRLSSSKKNLINKIYNKYSFDEAIIEYLNDEKSTKKIVLPKNFKKVNIEIGFGNGEFLINNAVSNPRDLFIGVEVYINGIAKVLKTIIDLKLENIILSNLNSFYFLKAMPYRSVDNVFIINPDPWLKKRHNKRRLISYELVRLLTAITKSKYSIYITTDSISYLNDIKNLLGESEVAFGNYNTEVLSKNSKLYGISRYQMKAIEKGGKIYQITF